MRLPPFRGGIRPTWPYRLNRDSPLSRGLVACFPVTPHDGRTLYDLTQSGATATATNLSLVRPGVDGFELYNDGSFTTSTYVLGGIPIAGGTQASVSAWVQASTSASANGSPWAFGGPSVSHYMYSGLAYFNTFRSSRVDAISMPGSIGRWHLLTITTDGSVWTMYYDATLVTQVAAEASVHLTLDARLMCGGRTGDYVFYGSAHSICFWNRALSQVEVGRHCSQERRWDLYAPA